MKLPQVMGAVLTIALLVSGGPVSAGIIGKSNEDVKKIADPLIDGVFDGLMQGDYKVYTEHFDLALRETISENRFKEIYDDVRYSLGQYLYREYLGFLNKEQVTVVLYKGMFDKTANEVFVRVTISKRDQDIAITGLTFE
ncbi:MAG: hypothetical protein NC924_05315 [Candidatus Omnitrophica bacterium]|nr:hypothetical protein [Candidatus Omnitrophota bacterium]